MLPRHGHAARSASQGPPTEHGHAARPASQGPTEHGHEQGWKMSVHPKWPAPGMYQCFLMCFWFTRCSTAPSWANQATNTRNRDMKRALVDCWSSGLQLNTFRNQSFEDNSIFVFSDSGCADEILSSLDLRNILGWNTIGFSIPCV